MHEMAPHYNPGDIFFACSFGDPNRGGHPVIILSRPKRFECRTPSGDPVLLDYYFTVNLTSVSGFCDARLYGCVLDQNDCRLLKHPSRVYYQNACWNKAIQLEKSRMALRSRIGHLSLRVFNLVIGGFERDRMTGEAAKLFFEKNREKFHSDYIHTHAFCGHRAVPRSAVTF